MLRHQMRLVSGYPWMSTIGVPPMPSCTYASDTPLRTSLRSTVNAFGSGRSGTAGVSHDGDGHDVGSGDRPRGARGAGNGDEVVLLVQERVRRRAQHEHLSRVPGAPRIAAGARCAGV